MERRRKEMEDWLGERVGEGDMSEGGREGSIRRKKSGLILLAKNDVRQRGGGRKGRRRKICFYPPCKVFEFGKGG